MREQTTHFGFEQVATDEKVRRVAGVFDSVADKYDLMNDLMSLGIHRLWKRFTIEKSGARRGHHILDIAGGTGDLTARFADIVGPSGSVTLADINASMLNNGRERLIDSGHIGNIRYTQANAEQLPFADNQFDIITIAFGLRNVTDKEAALRSMARVVKPGGRVLILEFSKPTSALLNKLYDLYSFQLLPRIGQLVANDADSYRYLAESIRMHPDQATMRQMVLDHGFDECDVTNLSQGIVALHRGFKY
ncbi:bifunctional demethylmenaquinone methyltransferase/2-methoxy-6-polyprenyl-1,4-benzoquinol methylase UbiE [Ectothiorhodospiraceae bacterium BW-2]|nr:bifunctional demethylmenaquinone methyltransferase/2-methoxy-6-polyprenyl-1,4-benzoquinol methylase UbiE [Ectothiorhodospiraceae bacterium BW-2]